MRYLSDTYTSVPGESLPFPGIGLTKLVTRAGWQRKQRAYWPLGLSVAMPLSESITT
jgi:hypothetical protein